MISEMGFPMFLASYPVAAAEAEFGKARFLLIVTFGALIYMLPSILNGDPSTVCQQNAIFKDECPYSLISILQFHTGQRPLTGRNTS
jgi:hypothetical protein